MRVDAARLAAWRSEVALAAADAELNVSAELESWAAAHPGRTVEEARDAAIATASRASSAYGRVSAATSGRLFDELAEAQGHGARFEVVDTTDAAYTEEAVRKLANRLRDGDEVLPPMYFPPFTPMIHNRSRQPAPAGYANVFPPLSAPPSNLSRNARASRARALSEPG